MVRAIWALTAIATLTMTMMMMMRRRRGGEEEDDCDGDTAAPRLEPSLP